LCIESTFFLTEAVWLAQIHPVTNSDNCVVDVLDVTCQQSAEVSEILTWGA